MSSKAPLLLLLALGACPVSPPEGAYMPVYTDGGVAGACREGFQSQCTKRDAGKGTDIDGGKVDPELDAAEVPVGPDLYTDSGLATAAIAGRYLMRIDYYSTVQGMEAGATLKLKTRVSNLFLTTLYPAGNNLVVASEEFCFQNSVHLCESACSGWQTTYADPVAAKIQQMDPISRGYVIGNDNSLAAPAEGALLRLGYDDAALSMAPIPDGYQDPRVWKLASATDSLRGIATQLTGKLIAGPVMLDLDCEVDSVQQFATAFGAKLPTLDAAGLAGRVMEVNSTGTDARAIAANGKPDQYCVLSKLQPSSSGERGFVRFKRTDITRCPATAGAFESAFKLPDSENLDPPTPTDAPPP